jgi:hypothetical protein
MHFPDSLSYYTACFEEKYSGERSVINKKNAFQIIRPQINPKVSNIVGSRIEICYVSTDSINCMLLLLIFSVVFLKMINHELRTICMFLKFSTQKPFENKYLQL